VRSQRVVYVSDLAPTSQQSRSALDLDFPPRLDRSVTGRQLSIRGCRFEKGIGVHAFSSLTFNLDGQFEKFLATVGIDDSAAPYGSVVFRVLVDGKPLFESRPLRGDEPAMPIAIDVRGGSVLTLECRDAGDLDISDHADWADALLLRAKASTIR
jgi:beta-galactosidase